VLQTDNCHSDGYLMTQAKGRALGAKFFSLGVARAVA